MNPSNSPTVLPHNFTPRAYQRPGWDALTGGIERGLFLWHRRSGKDKTCFNLMLKRSQERVGNYAYIYPTYRQGKKALWNAIDKDGFKVIDHCPPALLAKPPNETEMLLSLTNGSTIQVIGADNIDSIVGTNPVGIVLSEYALMAPSVLDFLRPILRENGGWLVVNFTPRGQNHAFDLYEAVRDNPDWYVSVLTVDDTGVLSADDIDAERRAGMSEELIQQEFFVNFESGNVGSYYGRLLADASSDGRIGRVAYEPGLPVHTRWDLGVGDATAIWLWQDVGRERRFVDYYEASGEGLPHYVAWLQGRGYVYGRHYAPHDIAVREFSSGVSRLDTARTLGIRFEVVPLHSLEDGIEAVRQELPRCWFDKERCKDGIAALRDYHKDYDEVRQVFRPRPAHSWSSHGSDAFRTGSMGHIGGPVVSWNRPPTTADAPWLRKPQRREEERGWVR
jgi:hypothetical protein